MSDNGERYSPFNFAFNNPVLLNDPTGLWPDSIMTSDGTWAYTANPWMEHVVVVAGKGKPRYGGMLSYGNPYDPSKDDYYLEWQSQIRGNGTGVGLGRSALTGQREELPYFKIIEEVNRRLAEALSGIKLSDISSGATENLKDKWAAVTSKDYWLHLALTVSQGPISVGVDQLKGIASTIEDLSGKSSGEIIGYVGVELGIALLTRRAGRFTRAAAREVNSSAHLATEGANLSKHLGQLEKYGQDGFKELQNGRFRYYGNIKPATNVGEMQGARLVREWNPTNGNTRTWYETLDHAGKIRQVHPKYNNLPHYKFDASGKYTGKW